jgi:hypothetical protein
MDVKYGNPSLPQPPVDLKAVRANLNRLFGESFDADILCKAVSIAVQSHHGAVVVISTDAAGECERIAGKAGIKPLSFDDQAISGAMSIDGAIMLDPQGVCHGVGLILDGTVGPKEDPSRGARYNSVRRYIHGHANCVIVVVSEDGMINLLPDD